MNSGPWSSTAVFNGLSAGSYFVSVKDSNNCLDTLSVFLPLSENPGIDSANWSNPTCESNNGWLEVFVNHPDRVYMYSIDGATHLGLTVYSKTYLKAHIKCLLKMIEVVFRILSLS